MSKHKSEIVNKDMILFALYELGGAQKPIHTEDIAFQVFKYPIGKQKYRWDKYEIPDKERIARELRWLKNWKGKNYVKGHVNIGARSDRIDGWMLTATGVEHVKTIEKKLRKALDIEVGSHSIYQADELRKQIGKSKCYKFYLQDRSLSNAKDHDFTDMLYCLPDASTEKIKSALDKLIGNARAVDADDILLFLEAAQKRFSKLLKS